MSQPDFDTTLTAWKRAVAKQPHAPLPQEIEAENDAQYTAWIETLVIPN